MAQLAPSPWFTGLDNNGNPIAGGLLFTYAAGTTTKLATYSDEALTVANANPIVLDSAGRATIFLLGNSYKFTLAPAGDTDPPTSPIRTQDNINSAADFDSMVEVQGTAGEALALNDVVYLSAGDGGRTAGRWYKADADLTYASVSAKALGMVPVAIASGSAGAIRMYGRMTGLSGLTAGSLYFASATAGALTATAPTNRRPIGVADSTSSLLLNHFHEGSLPRTDVFTSNGTWIKHPDAMLVNVILVAGGGGGGSGRRGAEGTARGGGGGGAGGGYTLATLPVSILGATETVTVGTLGAGGAAVGADNTDGLSGSAGGDSGFGAWAQAAGGGGGGGGTVAGGTAGAAPTFGSEQTGGNGEAGNAGGGAAAGTGFNGHYFAAAGGGGGGGRSAGNVSSDGGPGGQGSMARNTALAGGTGGVVAGAAPTAGTSAAANEPAGGGGGGGGSGSPAQAGAVGGLYGGGGGGGGASINGAASGAGGNGRLGIVIVTQW